MIRIPVLLWVAASDQSAVVLRFRRPALPGGGVLPATGPFFFRNFDDVEKE